MVGSTLKRLRSLRRRLPLLLFGVTALAVSAAIAGPPQRTTAADCVFPFTPTSYEDLKDRQLFLNTIDLASFNLLFPGDPYFGLPDLKVGNRQTRHTETGKIPPAILKAIAWIESSITQGGADVPFGSIGPALISFDCGHGITQVTSGMTLPAGENGRGSPEQALVATHFAYNIARGAVILANKWNEAPDTRPIAGIDTNGHPGVMENWYFAVWSYNGFTGPGANRSNHPLDPIYGSWPRAAYSCGTQGDGKGHNRGNYPYQELVFGCATNPPAVDGRQLWQAQPISLPDLNNPAYKNALKLDNFVYPYAKMDMPSPQPLHVDTTAPPNPALRSTILGSPMLQLSQPIAKIGFAPDSGSTSEVINIVNMGSGVLAWYAVPSVPWLSVTPYTGIAAGPDLRCTPNSPCDKAGHMELTVDSSKAPPGRSTASVTIKALGSNQSTVLNVEVSPVVRIGVPGVAKN